MRRILALAVVLVCTPALAEDPTSKLDLFSAVVGGMTDGAKVSSGPISEGTVSRTAPGVFTIVPASGPSGSFTATEPESCVFEFLLDVGDAGNARVRFDFNHVTGVVLNAAKPVGALNAIDIGLNGSGKLVQIARDGGELSMILPNSTLVTSMSMDEVQAAADALRAQCPGVAG